MDDGEVESPSTGGGEYLDYSQFLDDSSVSQNDWGMQMQFGTQICSHKHICNPTTGPDNTHTHTCEHTHTHTIPSGDEEKLLTKKRRPSGNKEAVRKYREKQKAVKVTLEAKCSELEKENRKIPELLKENLILRRKLQEQSPRQDAVEHLLAENKRLKSLLSQLRRTIDKELEGPEDASYQDLLFAPYKKDRAAESLGPGHLSSLGAGPRCAAPVPCFPTRPLAHPPRPGELMDHDVEHMDGSLGWHVECELGDKAVSNCLLPQEKTIDAHVGKEEVATPASNTNGSPSSSQRQHSCGCPPSFAGDEILDCGFSNPGSQSVQQQPNQSVSTSAGGLGGPDEHQEEIPCSTASLSLPCFNKGGHPSVNSGSLQPMSALRGAQQVQNHLEDSDIICGGAEVGTDDSCPMLSSSSEEGGGGPQAPNVIPAALPSSKATDSGRSANFLFPACLYTDEVMGGGVGPAASWNPHQQLSPNAIDRWLEECDLVDGVCQAHLANAYQIPRIDYTEVGGPLDGVAAPAASVPT